MRTPTTPSPERRGRCCARTPRTCPTDRKSTRLNSSHSQKPYAVFCLKKKKKWPAVNKRNEKPPKKKRTPRQHNTTQHNKTKNKQKQNKWRDHTRSIVRMHGKMRERYL